ncbi:MAG: hypothetical protein JSS53_06070 [Proteobacteria bacterium]|nr:hypothetical protein [Pseudomonadota bacterium]
MLMELTKTFSQEFATLSLLLILINAIVHILFAGAVAKDSGKMSKLGEKTLLVSGITWAFATLVGGVFVAAVYWVFHHSKLTRN